MGVQIPVNLGIFLSLFMELRTNMMLDYRGLNMNDSILDWIRLLTEFLCPAISGTM